MFLRKKNTTRLISDVALARIVKHERPGVTLFIDLHQKSVHVYTQIYTK